MSDFVDTEADSDEECVTFNPYCPLDVDGRDCIADAGHAGDCVPMPLSESEKIDYLFTQAKAMEGILAEVIPQTTALLAQAGPMLESLAPLLGQASSPMGRIFGSFLPRG